MNRKIKLAAALLIGLCGGCYMQPPETEKDKVMKQIFRLKQDGHKYLLYVRGGIIHDESCTNATHQYIKLQ